MAVEIALLSDPTLEANEQLGKLLAGVGFLTFWAPAPAQLERELAKRLVVSATSLFVVVDVMLAKTCARALERCAVERARVRAPRAALVLLYEPGGLTTIPRPCSRVGTRSSSRSVLSPRRSFVRRRSNAS